jgi:hypothetical protein
MNADFNSDINRIVDRKIADLFKNYSTQFEAVEDKQDTEVLNKINTIEEKLNLILNAISSGNISNINTESEDTSKTRKRRIKKDEVFIPVIEKTESIISTKEDKSKTIESGDMFNTLSALNNL